MKLILAHLVLLVFTSSQSIIATSPKITRNVPEQRNTNAYRLTHNLPPRRPKTLYTPTRAFSSPKSKRSATPCTDASPIVSNGDFETPQDVDEYSGALSWENGAGPRGSYAGFTLGDGHAQPRAFRLHAASVALNSFASLTQSIALCTGTEYQLTAWGRNSFFDASMSSPCGFDATISGTPVVSSLGGAGTEYVGYVGTYTAVAEVEELSFEFSCRCSQEDGCLDYREFFLDDVAVDVYVPGDANFPQPGPDVERGTSGGSF